LKLEDAHGPWFNKSLEYLAFIARQYDYIVELVAILKYAEKKCKKKKENLIYI